MDVHDLGLLDYREALDLQRRWVGEIAAGTRGNSLLLVQHPPVITLGSGAAPTDVLAPPAELADAGIDVVSCDRGGAATYHGPGQLVGYPLIDLEGWRKDLGAYLRELEAGLMAVLERLGIASHRQDGETGVWTARGKIAAIGVRVTRWITSHGFALNVDPDLDHFRYLVPCSNAQASVASIAQFLDSPPTLEQVATEIASEFKVRFNAGSATVTSNPDQPLEYSS